MESNCIAENEQLMNQLIEELGAKLKEARSIAEQVASTEVVIKNLAFNDMDIEVEKLKQSFIKETGYYPERIYLVVEGQNHNLKKLLM